MNQGSGLMQRSPTLEDLPAPPAGKRGWPWNVGVSPCPPTRPDGSAWPRISITTPSLNQGEFLEETIRSVLLQGYPNLEYSIFDGGSADGSLEIIRRYEPWLASWASRPDAGQSDAINQGLAAATGEILGWLNSDDYLAQDALRVVATALADSGPGANTLMGAETGSVVEPAVGAVVGAGHKIDARGKVFYSPLPAAVNRDSLLRWCEGLNFLQPACLFTRAAWQAAGPLRPDLEYCMDLALWLRIAESYRFVVLPDTLAFVHDHDAAKTSRERHRMFAEIALLLATEGGDYERAKSLLFTVLDADDTHKRGIRHLSRALGREVMRRLRNLAGR
jgi:glycosyltransferase involved in cell wall biosynthesis